MGIFPIFMNIVQFWLIDSIVKASATQDEPTHQDRDPLLSAPAEDDNEQPSPRPETANRRRSVSSLDSRYPEPNIVTYQTIITIPEEQESGASSSSRSYPLIVQTPTPRFAVV